MFYPFIRPPCQRCTNEYETYHKSFVSLLSNLSTNKVKNETLATQLCEYFDIKKTTQKDLIVTQFIDLVKDNKLSDEDYKNISQLLNKEPVKEDINFNDILKKAGETTFNIFKEKGLNVDQEHLTQTLESISDMTKNIDANTSPDQLINLLVNIAKTFLTPVDNKVD